MISRQVGVPGWFQSVCWIWKTKYHDCFHDRPGGYENQVKMKWGFGNKNNIVNCDMIIYHDFFTFGWNIMTFHNFHDQYLNHNFSWLCRPVDTLDLGGSVCILNRRSRMFQREFVWNLLFEMRPQVGFWALKSPLTAYGNWMKRVISYQPRIWFKSSEE